MKPFSPTLNILGTSIAALLAFKGKKRRSLSSTGALSAFIVGYLSIACGLRGILLLFFYLVGTKATKFKNDIKKKIDGDVGHSSVRGPHQVLACSGIAVLFSLYHAYKYGEEKNIDYSMYPSESCISMAIVSHYATCLADTLASELGILSKTDPFLITDPRKKVPRGTNGGVSWLGFLWSAVGGAAIGMAQILIDTISGFPCRVSNMLVFSTLCGLIGSVFDSILGATLQATYYDREKKMVYCSKNNDVDDVKLFCGRDILTNAQVNFVSVLLTTVIGGYWLGPCVFQ